MTFLRTQTALRWLFWQACQLIWSKRINNHPISPKSPKAWIKYKPGDSTLPCDSFLTAFLACLLTANYFIKHHPMAPFIYLSTTLAGLNPPSLFSGCLGVQCCQISLACFAGTSVTQPSAMGGGCYWGCIHLKSVVLWKRMSNICPWCQF